MATLIKQLTKMTQKVIKPAFAPNTVVAINSPDPTIDADRINPGPKNFNLVKNELGGSLMSSGFLELDIREDKHLLNCFPT